MTARAPNWKAGAAAEIAKLLNQNAEEILRGLFPLGRKVGTEFKVGNIRGDAGESLSISLNGSGAANPWADFAENISGGDLLDLLITKQGGDRKNARDKALAMEEAA